MVSHESEGGFCYVFVQNKHIRSLFAISLGKNTQLKEVVSHQQSICVYLLICLYGLMCLFTKLLYNNESKGENSMEVLFLYAYI